MITKKMQKTVESEQMTMISFAISIKTDSKDISKFKSIIIGRIIQNLVNLATIISNIYTHKSVSRRAGHSEN